MSKGVKTGGRKQGTPNKVTSTIRNWLVELINDNRDVIAEDFAQLEPKERLVMLEKLLPYIMPKVQSADEVEGACFTREDIEESDLGDFDDLTQRKVLRWFDKE